MKIQIDGTNIQNKGSELMLYAILEQVEQNRPDTKVLWNDDSYIGSVSKIDTRLDFKKSFWQNVVLCIKPLQIIKILRKLRINHYFLTNLNPIKGINVVLDASGFHYSDQFKIQDKYCRARERYFRKLKRYGTKIYFLPQAFGPFNTISGKKMAKILTNYADLIFVRDQISLDYFHQAGIRTNKLIVYPDFTNLTTYTIPQGYEFLKNYVCIIPNKRMIDKGAISSRIYLKFLENTIHMVHSKNHQVFLLNHESKGDLKICQQINSLYGSKVQIISGLNAKEIKGVISICKMVISSRFHGVANALNTEVPCLATGWSHKYAMLFADYQQNNCILDLENETEYMRKIEWMLSDKENEMIRLELKKSSVRIKEKSREMWQLIWEKIDE